MKRSFVLLVGLLLGVLSIAWVVAQFVRSNLEKGAMATIRQVFPEDAYPNLSCRFIGQTAYPAGTVFSDEEKDRLLALLSKDVRTTDHWWMMGQEKELNPVSAVVMSNVQVESKQPAWIALAALADRVRVDGQVATEAQSTLLRSRVQGLIGKETPLDWQLQVSPDVSRQQVDPAPTLESMTAPQLSTTATGSYHLAQLGRQFTQPLFATAKGDLPAEEINRTLAALGLPTQPLQSLLSDCRAYKAAQDKIASLPTPHLDLISYGKQLFLSGELRSEKAKEQVLAAAQQFYAPMKVVDGVRVSDRRRNLGDLGETLTTFPNLPDTSTAGLVAFAEPGKAWLAKALPPSGLSSDVKSLALLPESFDPALLGDDFSRHISGVKEHLNSLKPASHVALLASAKGVTLRGDVPTPELAQQLQAAAQKAYPTLPLKSEIRITTATLAPTAPGATLTSFPSVPKEGAAVLGLAKVGQAWRKQPLALGAPAPSREQLSASALLEGTESESALSDVSSLSTLWAPAAPPPPTATPTSTQPAAGPPLWLIGTTQRLTLRGEVPTRDLRTQLRTAVAKAYPDAAVETELTVNPTLPPVLPQQLATTLLFPPLPETKGDGLIAKAPLGADWTVRPLLGREKFSPDTLVSTGFIPAGDAAQLEQATRLGKLWRPRTTGPEEGAYLSLLAANGTLRITGEVADDATRTAILTAVSSKWAGWQLQDELRVVLGVRAATQLDTTLASLPTPAPERTTTTLAQGILDTAMRVNVVHSIYFRTGVSGFSNDGERAIRQMQQILAIQPTAKFHIIGHSDNMGDPENNQQLSASRAKDFRAYATQRGLPDASMTDEGKGPSEPLGDNSSSAGRARNRRVDILLQ